MIAAYVWQILGKGGRGGVFLPPPYLWAAPKRSILNRVRSFGNSRGNSYIKFLLLDIKVGFTCGKCKLYQTL